MTAGFLIVRRAGALWGLPAGQVSSIQRIEPAARDLASPTGSAEAEAPSAPGRFELRLAGGGSLAVDAVLTLAAELRIQPVSQLLRRFLPRGSSGLAMHGGEPLLLLAPDTEAPHV
ncbi:MAG: hypothetical protein ABIV06_08440 [Thermoanaerobaculia bacterium]